MKEELLNIAKCLNLDSQAYPQKACQENVTDRTENVISHLGSHFIEFLWCCLKYTMAKDINNLPSVTPYKVDRIVQHVKRVFCPLGVTSLWQFIY